MPRYFFHLRIGDTLMWDGVWLDLPDPGLKPVSREATALWTAALAGQVRPGRILVTTNDVGQVLFVIAQ